MDWGEGVSARGEPVRPCVSILQLGSRSFYEILFFFWWAPPLKDGLGVRPYARCGRAGAAGYTKPVFIYWLYSQWRSYVKAKEGYAPHAKFALVK